MKLPIYAIALTFCQGKLNRNGENLNITYRSKMMVDKMPPNNYLQGYN